MEDTMKSTAKSNGSSKSKKGQLEPRSTNVAQVNSRSFQTRAPGSSEKRRAVITLLNQHVADSLDLYSQVKHAHWNVKGPEFGQLHELFDEIAEHLEKQTDLVAERSTALGGFVPGTARQAVAASRLPEYSMEVIEGMQHVTALADRLAALAQYTREEIDACEEQDDIPSSDLLTDVSRELEMDLWKLEAHLQSEARGRLNS
jgi:starvation-inducible DNA-binding protein